MKEHILIYSQYFYPEQFRINDIATSLEKKGYKVSVVTGIPNYPEGKFFEGFSWNKRRTETWKNIDIYRMPIIPRGKTGIGLILNYLSFVITSLILQHRLPKDVDAVFTYEVSPMTQALPAIWLSKKFRVKHTLYVMDLWPENVVAVTGLKNKFFIKLIDYMVDYIYKNTDFILTSSKSFKESIISRGVSKKKIEFWPQYAEDIYNKKDKDNSYVEVPELNTLSFVFAGNVGFAQGLEILPKAAKKLKDQALKIKFVIIGDGRAKEKLISLISELDVEDYFLFIERQPAEKIPYYLAKFDIALITLNADKIFSQTIPAKIQSLMACGKPLLVSADGEVQEIIKESEAGLASSAGDIEGLVRNIKLFLKMDKESIEQMGENATIYSNNNYNKEKLLVSLEKNILG